MTDQQGGQTLKPTFKLKPLVVTAAAVMAVITIACNNPGASPPATLTGPEQPADYQLDGNADANGNPATQRTPVIVEFGDFQCPYCARFALNTLSALRRDVLNDGAARFEYRHYPFLSPESTMAAEASECARDQGRFDAYHDGVYELLVKREGISAASLGEVAGRLGLDMAGYEACTRNRTHRERVEADKEYGRSLGVQGTPSLFIDGEQLDWYSYRNLVSQIREHANPGIQGKDGS